MTLATKMLLRLYVGSPSDHIGEPSFLHLPGSTAQSHAWRYRSRELAEQIPWFMLSDAKVFSVHKSVATSDFGQVQVFALWTSQRSLRIIRQARVTAFQVHHITYGFHYEVPECDH